MKNSFNNPNNYNPNNNIYKGQSIPNNNNEKEPEETIPRPNKNDEGITKINDESSINNADIINLNLHASSGLKVMIVISKYKTIEELLQTYMRRIGVSEALIGTDIIFIFKATTINPHDKRLICELFTQDFQVITVVDGKNIIGAKNK